MIDENILIKVFENRIDTFLKQHISLTAALKNTAKPL